MPKKPTYQRIKESILANIHTGMWQVGAAIPTEMALCEQFGVSRMTVNRALKELESERILERRQGSGTFVAQQKFNHTFIEVRNIAQDILDSQKNYQAKVNHQATLHYDELNLAAHHWLKQRFFGNRLTKSDKLYQVSIVHYANDTPIQYEERWVNARLVPEFIKQDFTVINTSDYLIAHVPLESGEYRVMARNPDNFIKKILQMLPDEPALLHTRQTNSQGQVVSIVNMWHAGNRHYFSGQL